MKNEDKSLTSKRNPIADCFKLLSIFTIFIGFLLIVFYFFIAYKENMINFYFIISIVFYILSATIVFFVLRAIAEIIQLLEDIKNK